MNKARFAVAAAIALVLVLAAAGKVVQPPDLPFVRGAVEKVLLWVSVVLNAAIATAVLVRPHTRWAWGLCLLGSAAFAGFSAAAIAFPELAKAGCGCFGRAASFDPRTTFGIAAAMFLAALWMLPTKTGGPSWPA